MATTKNLERKNITFTPDEWENFIADVKKQVEGKVIIDFESATKKARQNKIEKKLQEYAENFDRLINSPRNIENLKHKEGKIIIKKSEMLELARKILNDPDDKIGHARITGEFMTGPMSNYDVNEYIRASRGYSDKSLDEIFNTKVTLEDLYKNDEN